MCDKACIKPSDYVVMPLGNPGLSQLFSIDFVGDNDGTNNLLAKKARECLRNPDGSWIELLVTTPAGPNTKAYINPDKSPKVKRVALPGIIVSKLQLAKLAEFLFTNVMNPPVALTTLLPAWSTSKQSSESRMGSTPP